MRGAMTEPNRPWARRSVVRTPSVIAAIVMITSVVSDCSSFNPDATVSTGETGSCAVVIEAAGSQYIGGRQTDSALPVTRQRLAATRLYCDESGRGHTSTTSIVATRIRGVPVTDAVAANGYQLRGHHGDGFPAVASQLSHWRTRPLTRRATR